LAALEVTLRTPAALEAIAEMRRVEGAVVVAGTVLGEAQLDAALAAGAQFIVAPGLTDRLTRAALDRGVAYLPGVANASDIMRGLDLGLTRFKFFPAEANGGARALQALCGPFGGARFCPTGGITPENAPEYLGIEQVACVGGTWLVRSGELDQAAIERRARHAAALRTRAT
jgi:2-dehydro-3-deoxyphosphogluconate aldolase / (4S)-4-hydroxy-2-oxoglutarate aldolase